MADGGASVNIVVGLCKRLLNGDCLQFGLAGGFSGTVSVADQCRRKNRCRLQETPAW